MAEKGELALTAAKVALKGVAGSGGEKEEDRAGPGWKKKALAASLGLVAAFYLVNQIIGLVPIINQLHYVFAGGIIYWSLSVWGIRPIKRLKERRARKKLAEPADDASDVGIG